MEIEKKCNGCKKILAMFNFISEERDKSYSKCHTCRAKLIGKKNVCQICGIRAIYNFEGQKAGSYCNKHKEIGMINVKSKTCLRDGCNLRPNFNFEGQKSALYCNEHKTPGMVNVISKTCLHDGCNVRPIYNFEGQKSGLYCNEHKTLGMVNVKSKTCLRDGCNLRPNFNFEGQKSGLYCNEHKTPGMIDVISKTCLHDGCNVRPTYNFEGQKSSLYCNEHKEINMIDIKHKTCSIKGCRLRSCFNLPGMFPDYCTRHKKDGMIVQPRKKCETCNEIAVYGIITQMHCEEHKLKDEYNLIERTCQNLTCPGNRPIDILDSFGNCVSFCSAVKQSEMYQRHQKKKEEFVGKLLADTIHLSFYLRDQVGDNKCSKSRPDFVYHLGTHILVIEVDEHQHKSYNSCGNTKEERYRTENRRMYNVSHEFDGLPIIFIRYNPDSFRVDGKIIKVPDQKRHDILVRWIKKCISEPPKEGIWIKYLFYDEYKESDINFIKLTENDFNVIDFV